MTSPEWLENFHSFFIFISFFYLRKVKYFLIYFSNLLIHSFLNYQSIIDGLFCENNPKWPNTKRCFNSFDFSRLTAPLIYRRSAPLNETTRMRPQPIKKWLPHQKKFFKYNTYSNNLVVLNNLYHTFYIWKHLVRSFYNIYIGLSTHFHVCFLFFR